MSIEAALASPDEDCDRDRDRVRLDECDVYTEYG